MNPDFVEKQAQQFYDEHRRLVKTGEDYKALLLESRSHNLLRDEITAVIGRIAIERDANLWRAQQHVNTYLDVYIAVAKAEMATEIELKTA